MRVLQIGSLYPPHHFGGYELAWRGAVGALRARGDEVRVLTTDFRRPDPDPEIPEDTDVHRELRWYWRDHAFPPIGFRDRLALERHNQATLKRHLDEFEPDVVSFWAMGGMSLSLIETVRRTSIPALGVVLDDWLLYAFDFDAWTRMFRRRGIPIGAVERLTGVPGRLDFDSAATWAFISEHTRSAALEAVPLSRTAIANAGVDRELFTPHQPAEWRGRLAVVGRIDERKGIGIAIRALAELPEATLTINGSGSPAHQADLEALAGEIGVADRVTFAQGARTSLPAVYAAADAVLFPVLWPEPWGIVPLEAMAVGRPVVATGTGGSREYLRDGENCLIYAPRDDPAALAAAVERLAGDAALRETLRTNGFETAARYDERNFVARIAELLDSVAGG